MTANPPHPPGPAERTPPRRHVDDPAAHPLSGGTSGILAVMLATVALALAGAAIAGLVSWLV